MSTSTGWSSDGPLPAVIEFGCWQIAPYRRDVLRNGMPTKLAGRAFDVLVALIEARGKVVTSKPYPTRSLKCTTGLPSIASVAPHHSKARTASPKSA